MYFSHFRFLQQLQYALLAKYLNKYLQERFSASPDKKKIHVPNKFSFG